MSDRTWSRYLKLEGAANAWHDEYVTTPIGMASKVITERILRAIWRTPRRFERPGQHWRLAVVLTQRGGVW